MLRCVRVGASAVCEIVLCGATVFSGAADVPAAGFLVLLGGEFAIEWLPLVVAGEAWE